MADSPSPASTPLIPLPLPSVSPPLLQPNTTLGPPLPTNSTNPPPSPPTQPPSSSAPPPVSLSPPPPVQASPPISLSPPPPVQASPPISLSPPPPVQASPPISLSPPPPTLSIVSPSPPAPSIVSPSPPPPSIVSPPPPARSIVSPSPPPLSSLSPPPPSSTSPPPVSSSLPPPPTPVGNPPTDPPPISSPPPPIVSPLLPSPPPPSLSPPSIPPSPQMASNSPPPPSTKPSKNSPPPSPPLSPAPPSDSPPKPLSPPPPRTQLGDSSPPPPVTNLSTVPSPLATPPTTPLGNLNPPTSPTPTKSSNSTPHVVIPSGNVTTAGSGGIKAGGVVAVGVLAFVVALSLAGIVIWFVKKRKRREKTYGVGYVIPSPYMSPTMSDSSYSRSPPSSAPLVRKGSGSTGYPYSSSEPGGVGNSRPWFTYKELLDATNGFSENNILGEGGFGPVYKGCLPDGREVAVKQLKIGGGQGEREFQAEIEIISRVHHRHLVSLVGYCMSDHQRLLAYDYVPNNTLHYHLHEQIKPVMDWATRVKVAAGAARGIAYLHEACHPRIIHRDIKSSNILLDDNFEAQVSDFGLARLALDSLTHVSTRVMGTFGYMAPEYASSGKLTEKSDVFSFGVVLLEVVTGRKPVDSSQPLGDESLVEWARPLLTQALDSGDFDALVDPRLDKNYVESEMFRVIEAAAACVRHSAAKRPRMGQVVRALDSISEFLDLNNGMRPGQSKLFDSAQQSAEIRRFQRMAFGSQDYSTDFSRTSWREEL